MRGRILAATGFWAVLALGVAAHAPLWGRDTAAGPKGSVVWLVVFTEPECPKCENVGKMVEALEGKYPIRTKVFRIDKERDRRLLRSIEKVHARGRLSVPLVIVGEKIIMGERRIGAHLEKEVRRLARSGGGSLPYLGPGAEQPDREASEEPCTECDRGQRVPDVRDEWKRIKGLLEEYF